VAWVGGGGCVGGGGVGCAGVGVAGTGLGVGGSSVGVGASVAEAGSVGGTSVAGGPGEEVPARATGFTVGVPSTVTFTVLCRLYRKKPTAMAMISTPSTSAIQGQRFDGSPVSAGGVGGGAVAMRVGATGMFRALLVPFAS
jgi:hypothetical protein